MTPSGGRLCAASPPIGTVDDLAEQGVVHELPDGERVIEAKREEVS
jgi:hypothetical protein